MSFGFRASNIGFSHDDSAHSTFKATALSIPPDIIDAILRIESQTPISQVEWFPELGSTNDHALELLGRDDCKLPRLIWAGRQTAGRGRGANQWWAAAGSLTFSLMVDARALGVSPECMPRLSVVTGLAIARALSRFVPTSAIGLKWPNDVQIHGRKVCGILVEAPAAHDGRLVIGVGVNVGNSFRDAPQDLRRLATSLCDLLPDPPAPSEVLLEFLRCWTGVVREFATGQLRLSEEWQSWCVLRGMPISATAGNTRVEGICHGMDDDGALLIDTPLGRVRQLSGTVRPLRDPSTTHGHDR